MHLSTRPQQLARSLAALAVLLGAAAGCARVVRVAPDAGFDEVTPPPPSALRGALVYRKACASCHGVEGDGRGRAAAGLDPAPRDFTTGTYRYRSTPSGSLPTADDLARTVREGAPGTAMPAWGRLLSPREIADVVAWLQTRSERFGEEEVDEPIVIPEPPAYTPESVARGREVYELLRCGTCHGERGRGDGWATADEMRDSLGRVVHARDFTVGVYRAGTDRQALYRTVLTGLDGSPMPAFVLPDPEGDIYHLVHYLLSLEQERGFWSWLTRPPTWHSDGDVRVAR